MFEPIPHAIVPTQNTLSLATAGALCLPGSHVRRAKRGVPTLHSYATTRQGLVRGEQRMIVEYCAVSTLSLRGRRISGTALLSVTWYFTPSALEEWARDSIFGNRANRKHLRDDLHAFDRLSLIQDQRKEPAHA